MEKSSNKLVDLSVAFAVEILNLVKYLKEQRETIICNQIGRAGTSIGANIHEAQYAHGKADFVSKLQIALKEANETSYWLLLCCYWEKQISSLRQNMIGWKLSAGKSE